MIAAQENRIQPTKTSHSWWGQTVWPSALQRMCCKQWWMISVINLQ